MLIPKLHVSVHARLSTGTSVKLEGQLQKSRGSGQAYELLVDQLAVLGTCGSVSTRPVEFVVKLKLIVSRCPSHIPFRRSIYLQMSFETMRICASELVK